MKRMIAGASLILAMAMFGCTATPAPTSSSKARTLDDETAAAMAQFKGRDPSLQQFLDKSYAYAIFPHVSEGAVGVGGAYGKGEVFRNGQLVGYADLSQANVGLQLGGQSYAELVCFQNAASFDQVRQGEMTFDARASAVAAASGAASAADYQRGVAIFTNTESGLMVQAAIGGQSIRYERASDVASER